MDTHCLAVDADSSGFNSSRTVEQMHKLCASCADKACKAENFTLMQFKGNIPHTVAA